MVTLRHTCKIVTFAMINLVSTSIEPCYGIIIESCWIPYNFYPGNYMVNLSIWKSYYDEFGDRILEKKGQAALQKEIKQSLNL